MSLSATDNITPPISMSLIKSVEVVSQPVSVHAYRDKVYVGPDEAGQLLQFDAILTGKQVLVNGKTDVTSVQVYRDEIYVWFAQKDLIHVFDMTGKLKRVWKHSCLSKYYNKLRVVSDKVVVSSA